MSKLSKVFYKEYKHNLLEKDNSISYKIKYIVLDLQYNSILKSIPLSIYYFLVEMEEYNLHMNKLIYIFRNYLPNKDITKLVIQWALAIPQIPL